MIDAEALRDELVRWRRFGVVFAWSAPHTHGDDAVGALRDLATAPPPPLVPVDPAELTPVDAATATRIVAELLERDLAYHVCIVEPDEAMRLAHVVTGTLPASARWWSNGKVGPGEWVSFTAATFDGGVIGISRDRALVVWFMDED